MSLHTISLTIFLYQLAWVAINVMLPFHILAISRWDEDLTLRWTGWILGVSALANVVTTPLWMRVSAREPRRCFVIALFLQATCFMLTAAARTLPELLAVRIALGATPPTSAFAVMIVARTERGDLRRGVTSIQTATMAGTVLAPLAAATSGVGLGYGPSFFAAAWVVVACALFSAIALPRGNGERGTSETPTTASRTHVTGLCVLVAVAFTQAYFLNSILPSAMSFLGVDDGRALHVAGWVSFVSGIGMVLGSAAAASLAERVGERKATLLCLTVSAIAVGCLAVTTNVWVFSAARTVQMMCIGPVSVLATARAARWNSPQVVGLVNTCRVLAGFTGPVVAANVLASSSIDVVFLTMAAMTLLCMAVAPQEPSSQARRIAA